MGRYAGEFIAECSENPHYSGEHLWRTDYYGNVRIQNGSKLCRYCEKWFDAGAVNNE